MAASLLRTSRFGKIAALTTIGGSFYLFRDDIRPLLKFKKQDESLTSSVSDTSKILETKKTIPHLPEKIPYLLIGGGTASHAAMRAIRSHDPEAKVLIITSENRSPYMRPALSKELWFTDKTLRRNLNFKWWSGKERSIFYEIEEFFVPLEDLDNREHGGVSLVKNTRLVRLEPEEKIAHLDSGQTIQYDKCLLAPGGTPKTLPVLESAPQEIKKRIIHYRTADDFLKLDEIADSARSIVIIGGGFLGSELACALSRRPAGDKTIENQTIYQIFPESGNLGKIIPKYLSEWLTKKVKNEGAIVKPNVEVKSVSMKGDSIEISLSDGSTITTDYIICAIGLEPDVELAKSSNLEVDDRTGGYLVNSELESRSDVWVAGDASCFYDIKLGRRRVEHHDHAINSGRQAGRNMIGDKKAYTHQPMFWSDLGPDLSFEAVGLIDSNLPTVAVFTEEPLPVLDEPQGKNQSEPEAENDKAENTPTKIVENPRNLTDTNELDKYPRGIVFYLKDGVVVGILLWNLFNRLNIARRILNEQKKYDDFNEVAKLFNIYLDDE